MRVRSVAAASVLASALVVLSGLAAGQPSDARLRAYGQHLASECTSCHRIDGSDHGIPSIIGWDRQEFAQTMAFYKDGARPNPAMQSVAQSLDADQIAALAAYFASLPKPPKRR